ncbi:MAG: WG repeat-containing protein [Treponemataceae bacterium]|nr:WG repeat-containing protein [Treponemataceae bacterium]
MKGVHWAPLAFLAVSSFLSCVGAPSTNYLSSKVKDGADLVPYRKGSQWGFADRQKKIILEPVYEEARCFAEGRAAVKKEGKWGFIDVAGKLRVPCTFGTVVDFEGPRTYAALPAKESNRWGVIDTEGNTILPFEYPKEGINIDRAGFVYFQIAGKWQGVITPTGKKIILSQVDGIDTFSEGFARVTAGGKWGFINEAGMPVYPPSFLSGNSAEGYEYASSFSEGRARVKIKGRWGFIDPMGKLVIPARFEDASSFIDGYAKVAVEGKYGLIDTRGRFVVPCIYDAIQWNSPYGPWIVERQNKYGFINREGKEILPVFYTEVYDFSEERALVIANTKGSPQYSFIDPTGKSVINCGPDEEPLSTAFIHGRALIVRKGKRILIDRAGKEVGEIGSYQLKEILSPTLILLFEPKKKTLSLLDIETKQIYEPLVYEGLSALSDQILLVKKEGQYTFIKRAGMSSLFPMSLWFDRIDKDEKRQLYLCFEKGRPIGYIDWNGNWFWED